MPYPRLNPYQRAYTTQFHALTDMLLCVLVVVKVLKPVHLRNAKNPIPFFYFVRDEKEQPDGLRQCNKMYPPESSNSYGARVP